MSARLTHGAYATPYELSKQRRDGEAPHANLRVVVPHGKSTRVIRVPLDRADLLTLIHHAAEALALLDREAQR